VGRQGLSVHENARLLDQRSSPAMWLRRGLNWIE
jgi:hypothetical protein